MIITLLLSLIVILIGVNTYTFYVLLETQREQRRFLSALSELRNIYTSIDRIGSIMRENQLDKR